MKAIQAAERGGYEALRLAFIGHPMKAVQEADRGGHDGCAWSTFPGRSLRPARPWCVSPQRE